MSDPPETRKSELETAGAALEEVVRGFEQAWRSGESPQAEDFLPPHNEPCGELLVELLHVELQCRLERGEQVRVEHLVQRFPALSADKEQILGLISAEYELRRRHSPAVDILEFTERFPQYRLDLEACLQAAPPHPHLKQPLRLNCPHCLNPMELNEAPGQEVN